jgi:hypothetical protein
MIFSIPYTISAPGSYRAARDLAGAPGITITADDVVLDLNGFAVRDAGEGQSGIVIPNPQSNVTILNGTVIGWPGKGITAPTTYGLKLVAVTVRNIGADSPGHQGVEAGDGASLLNCEVSFTGTGVVLGRKSTVVNCRVIDNASGLLTVGDDSVITGCVCYNNAMWQIITGANCVVKDCTCVGDAPINSRGLSVGAGSSVSGCSLGGFLGALSAGDGSTVRGCSIREFNGSPLTALASLGAGCRMSDCSLSGGASALAGCSFEGCTFSLSASTDGLTIGANSTVRACTVSGGGNGIVTAGTGSLIEGNRVSGASVGISVTGAGNIIVRNSVTGGAPAYSVGPNNAVGQIISVVGNASIVATNAVANFQY